MIKKRKVEDSPEFRYFEENFDEIIKEMEEDPELQNLKIPDEWDMRFRKTIEDTIKREEKKKNVKEKMLKWGSRVAVVAASVVLVMLVGMSMSAVTVQGEGLLDVFSKAFNLNNETYVTYGTDEEFEEPSIEEQVDDIVFKGENLAEIYEEVRSELKMPMFYFEDVFDDYTVKVAKYNKTYRVLSIQLNTASGYIFISQEHLTDDGGAGVIADAEKCAEVYNENLDKYISIYKGIQDDYYTFSSNKNYTIFALNGQLSLEQCKKIASSLYFE